MLSITAQKGKSLLPTLILKRMIWRICLANCSCAGCTEEAQETPTVQIISIQKESQALWRSGVCQSLDCNGHVSLRESHVSNSNPQGPWSLCWLSWEMEYSVSQRGWCEATSLPALLKSNYKFLLLAIAQVSFFFFNQDYVICIQSLV